MDARTSIKGKLPSRHGTAGRSANAALHLPAIAHACGIALEVAEIFKKTPCVADLKPGGRYVAKDLIEFGGLPVLLQTLLGFEAGVGSLNVKLTDPELVERKTKLKPGTTNPTLGVLLKYALRIGPAVDGAVTHPGGAHEKQCYADI